MNIGGRLETRTFTRDETIALSYSAHPLDPSRGISPAQTIRKWANVDDMIADYERGFFSNGAVPAGMMGIVSADATDFQRTKAQLENAFQGAGRNNGVVYNMIPVDPITSKPADTGKLVWVPFQQANNSLDLASLNDVVNNRLASALAVPDIVRGIDNGQTYANAEQAERSFVENTLKPLCMTVWDKCSLSLTASPAALATVSISPLTSRRRLMCARYRPTRRPCKSTRLSSLLTRVPPSSQPSTPCTCRTSSGRCSLSPPPRRFSHAQPSPDCRPRKLNRIRSRYHQRWRNQP